MEITEQMLKMVMVLILIIIGFTIFIFLIDSFTGGKVVRWIVCGILFWVPLGPMFSAVSQGCGAIPM